jgi:hypothetical protein
MNMKQHILAALREQFENWEKLLDSLSHEQLTTSAFDLDWSIEDVVAHLWAWQQISIARLEAGLPDRVPEYPNWITESIEHWEENASEVNALTFERYHDSPWPEVYERWKSGFLQLLSTAGKITERDLLDSSKFSWLNGYSLALILIASYDHHQEHFEKLTNWLNHAP